MKSSITLFVTGTDTEVGKTAISAALLHTATQRGLRTIGIKPVAAGCDLTDQGLRNEDALALQSVAATDLPYDSVNPIALREPIAPHIAAIHDGVHISVDQLESHCRSVLSEPYDMAIIEGAGGWKVPLNETETFDDFVKAMASDVILVVAMRLGCINHALLTVESIQRKGLALRGWVGNCVSEPMAELKANVGTLRDRIPAPMLGLVPHLNDPSPANISPHLNLDSILQ